MEVKLKKSKKGYHVYCNGYRSHMPMDYNTAKFHYERIKGGCLNRSAVAVIPTHVEAPAGQEPIAPPHAQGQIQIHPAPPPVHAEPLLPLRADSSSSRLRRYRSSSGNTIESKSDDPDSSVVRRRQGLEQIVFVHDDLVDRLDSKSSTELDAVNPFRIYEPRQNKILDIIKAVRPGPYNYEDLNDLAVELAKQIYVYQLIILDISDGKFKREKPMFGVKSQRIKLTEEQMNDIYRLNERIQRLYDELRRMKVTK